MKIYIAARFSKRPECNALAHRLQALGHTITSRWVKPDTDHVIATGVSSRAADRERERFALEDIEDLRACDTLVSLQEPERSGGRGGRHVEFGYALAMNARVIVIGPRETVFHHHPSILHFETIDQFIEAYTASKEPS